jgi:Tol biopolymer transport system component
MLRSAAVAALVAVPALASEIVAPNANLKVEGVPPIPAALAAKVAPYTEFRPRALASWHPTRHELIVATRAKNTAQLFAVARPLGPLTPLTDYAEPVRSGRWWPEKSDSLVFARDAGGNEQTQIYRLDAGAREPVLLTDARRIHQALGINRARNRLLIASADVDRNGGRSDNPTTDLSLLDPLEPARARNIATLPGTGWFDFSFSFDDRRVAMIKFTSVTDTTVWVMDVATGDRRQVLPVSGSTAKLAASR